MPMDWEDEEEPEDWDEDTEEDWSDEGGY